MAASRKPVRSARCRRRRDRNRSPIITAKNCPDGVTMPTTASSPSPKTQGDLFLRLWDREKLTPTLARHILKLGFSPDDLERIRDLSVKNRAGTLTQAERRELDEYLRVGMQLSILQSRARKHLKLRAGNGRG